MAQFINNISDIKDLESVPLERRDLPATSYEAIMRGAAVNPNKVALNFFMRGAEYKDVIFYTFEDLAALINQTANMFDGLGIRKTDVISMVLPNLPQSVFTIFGGGAAGIVNPINPLLEARQIAQIMNRAQSKVLVTLAPFIGTDIWQKVASIIDQVPTLEVVLRVDLTNYLSTFQKWGVKWVLLREDKGPKVKIPLYDFGQTARKFSGVRLVGERDIQGNDTALYFAGDSPTLIKQTHFNQVVNAWAVAETLALNSDQNIFCGSPLFQPHNLIFSTLTAWIKGCSTTIGAPSGFRESNVLSNFWEIMDFYKINLFVADPQLFLSLPDLPQGQAKETPLQFALCPISDNPGDLHLMERIFSGHLFLCYAPEPAAAISAINLSSAQKHIGSIGLRLPYHQIKVAERGKNGGSIKFCKPDQSGHFLLRGPHILNHAADKEQPGRGADQQGSWLDSGDIGRQDKEGYLWLEG